MAASVWVGGVATLAFLVWPLAPSLRRTAFLGFARLAVVLVAVMVLAGAYLALVRLPELSDLWETLYGRFLLLKVAIVARRAHLGRRPPLRRPASARGG